MLDQGKLGYIKKKKYSGLYKGAFYLSMTCTMPTHETNTFILIVLRKSCMLSQRGEDGGVTVILKYLKGCHAEACFLPLQRARPELNGFILEYWKF